TLGEGADCRIIRIAQKLDTHAFALGGCQCERAHMPDNCRAVYLYSIWYFAYIVTADCLYAVLG
ncbi:hypothetical protein, partial [Enterobacter hormaechei]|uniref:hypothetical protein n=1 Tax=Enterobacter hormaechei TaxID=158836 RepID=UPI001F3ACAB3